MTKEAQQQVRSEAFSDELFKIAAENVLGPDVDWDNLTPEQLEKVAFLRGLAKGLGRVAGGAVGATRSTGKYLGNKFKDVGSTCISFIIPTAPEVDNFLAIWNNLNIRFII